MGVKPHCCVGFTRRFALRSGDEIACGHPRALAALCLPGNRVWRETGEAAIRGMIERLATATPSSCGSRATVDLLKVGEAARCPHLLAATEGGQCRTTHARPRGAARHPAQAHRGWFRGAGQTGGERTSTSNLGWCSIAQILDPEVTEKARSLPSSTRGGSQGAQIARQGRRAGGARRRRHRRRLWPPCSRTTTGSPGDKETYDHPDNSSIHRAFRTEGRAADPALGDRGSRSASASTCPSSASPCRATTCSNTTAHARPGGQVDRRRDRRCTQRLGGGDAAGDRPEMALVRPCGAPRPQPAAGVVVERMLNNLASDCLEVGDRRRAALVEHYKRAIPAPGRAGAARSAQRRPGPRAVGHLARRGSANCPLPRSPCETGRPSCAGSNREPLFSA